MKLPNKLFSYKESMISKFPLIMQKVSEERNISIMELYYTVKDKFEDISEFLVTLDCLYVLGKIEYDSKLGRIIYVV